jgi:hypothetical protein
MGVICVDHNSSRIGPIDNNSNRGNSSNNSRNNSSSTVPLHHHHNRLPSGHHSSFLPTTFHASTVGRWATLLEIVVCLSKATRHELWHPWSISRGAIRRIPHHGRLAQLYHHGGDSHERRSASGYILPQRTPCYYFVRF